MIRYYKCANCGKRGLDNSCAQNKRFCSKKCSNIYHAKNRFAGSSCEFNEGVACEKHLCRNCGWNPTVANMRVEALV